MRLHFYLQASSRPAQLQAYVARVLQGNAKARLQRPARTSTTHDKTKAATKIQARRHFR
jgi:hypothetical protein